jgi:YVTN family beta-propeller protein
MSRVRSAGEPSLAAPPTEPEERDATARAEEARLIELGRIIDQASVERRRTRSGRGLGAFLAALFITFIVLVALTPRGVPILVPFTTQQLWVASHPGTQAPGSAVVRISLSKKRPERATETGNLPTGLGTSPDGRDVLVTNRGADTLSVIDTESGHVIHALHVGKAPDAVATGLGRHQVPLAIVANVFSDNVTIINLVTYRVVTTVRVGIWPSAVYVWPGAKGAADQALVADYGSNQLSTINLDTLAVTHTVAVGKYPNGIAVVPGGTRKAGVAAVIDSGSDEVTPVDLGRGVALPPIPLSASPTGIAGNGDGTVWITEGASLISFAPAKRLAGTAFPLLRNAQSIVLDPDGTKAWVGELGGVVERVDLQSGAVSRSYSVGGLPQSMIITTPLPGTTVVKSQNQ